MRESPPIPVKKPAGRLAEFLPRMGVLTAAVFVAAGSRLLPHPPNVTPIAAMALFGGATFSDRRAAFLVPLSALFVSDFFIGFHVLMPVVYGCFAFNVLLGRWLGRDRGVISTATACLVGSIFFFVVTNFAVWALGTFYPQTGMGLVACFVAALPFFRNTIIGDGAFTVVLFSGLWVAERAFPRLREPAVVAA
jgi:hypothetical protein